MTHVLTPWNDQLVPKRREINFVCQIWYRFVVLQQFGVFLGQFGIKIGQIVTKSTGSTRLMVLVPLDA